jgi:hypothetical protein
MKVNEFYGTAAVTCAALAAKITVTVEVAQTPGNSQVCPLTAGCAVDDGPVASIHRCEPVVARAIVVGGRLDEPTRTVVPCAY